MIVLMANSFDADVCVCVSHHFRRNRKTQHGIKVPLWGGFTGGGKFTLRLWTPRPKMKKEEWAALVPALKRAVDSAESRGPERSTKIAKVWHDNEGFLLQPKLYRSKGLQLVRFPKGSGDLNPIETVWAWLRAELGRRELDDMASATVLTVGMFRARVSQILHSYSAVNGKDGLCPLQRLVRGMPRRLAKCKANSYGHCGK